MAIKFSKRVYKSWRGFFVGGKRSKIIQKGEAVTDEYKNFTVGGYNVEGRDKAHCLE